jgi:hypothetical protein
VDACKPENHQIHKKRRANFVSFWTLAGTLQVGNFDPVGDGKDFVDDNAIGAAVVKVTNQGVNVTLAQAQAAALTATRNQIDTSKPGTAVILQSFAFLDKRTGAIDKMNPLIVPQSGFKIALEEEGKPNYKISITRTSEANNGAGKGIIADNDTGKTQPTNISIP